VQKNLARWKELAELAANEEDADRLLRWCAKGINFWNRNKGLCATYLTSPHETEERQPEGVHFMDHPNPNPRLFCAICSKQVDLRSAERDAYGKTVHRECHDFLYAVRSDDDPYAA